MGLHVVRALDGVGQIAHRRVVGRWHQPVEEREKVGLHVGVCVFLDQQRTGGMADKERQHTVAGGVGRSRGRDLVEPRPPPCVSTVTNSMPDLDTRPCLILPASF